MRNYTLGYDNSHYVNHFTMWNEGEELLLCQAISTWLRGRYDSSAMEHEAGVCAATGRVGGTPLMGTQTHPHTPLQIYTLPKKEGI